jgi:gliding motility-associated-like protein
MFNHRIMKIKQLTIAILWISSFLGPQAYAQIEAPDFICTRNDSLFWNLPQNNCGPFNAYLIYASQNVNGPYSVLATITDPGQTAYLHQNPGVNTWYYYMQSDYDCPGEIAMQSDTLDNEIPAFPIFESASVVNGQVVLSWSASTSPEVIGYIISRNIEGLGTITIDTVLGATSFTDPSADPTMESETFFLEALDECGNRSLITAPHSTMLLSADNAMGCNRNLNLSWSAYDGWAQGIAFQEIWVSKDGGTPNLVATIGGTATSFVYDDIDDKALYCVSVVAKANNEDWKAASNEICIEADVVQRQSYLIATNATVNADGSVNLSWIWNQNAELQTININQSTNPPNFTTVDSPVPTLPLPANNNFTDITANAQLNPVYYEIQSIDQCDVTVNSNSVGTIFLDAQNQDNTNILSWTPLSNDLATVNTYELYRVGAGGDVQIGTFAPNTTTGLDPIDFSNPEQLQACYYVEAQANLIAPDSSLIAITSRSNIACISQDASIYIPNAFSPNGDGRNDTFRPYLQYGVPGEYELIIYDRWGGQLFRSTDIDNGWDGFVRGEKATTGSYLYHLYLIQANGNPIETTGEIILLR